ncbi:MAG: hypothetical protein KGZ42_09490 [Melioribacter sp.]|nr:hypothetical protein [Melioribacter sp.]
MKERIIFSVIAAGLMFFITTCDTVENVIDKPGFKGKVVYVTHYDDSPKTELTVMNIDGTNKKVIDTSEKFYIYDPSWFKDGKKNLYTISTSKLFFINEDGSSKQDLNAQLFVLTPKASPNEKYIVYNLFGASPERPVLFEITQGRIIKQLCETYYSQDFGPNPWTSDNQKVLLHAKLERYGNYGLYFVDIATGKIDTIITSSQSLFIRPLLSKDEAEIIYSTSLNLVSSSYGTLKRLNIKTKNTTELKFSIPNLKILHPKYWTKDKRFLLFTVKNDSKKEFIVDLLYHDFLTGKTDYLLKNVSYDIDVWLEE